MHQLWKHKNGIWYILYGADRKRRVSTRQRERGPAEAYLAQYIAGASNPALNDPTIAELLGQYEEEHGPEVRSRAALKYNVIALNKHIGLLKPKHIIPPVIKKYAKDRGASPGTVLREVGVLRAALNWAVDHKRLPSAPHIPNPVQAPPGRQRWLTKAEGRNLIAACREPHMKLFVMLGLMTAARTTAILELTWDRVDLERGRIDYGAGHGNKRRAIAPINSELDTALRAAKEFALGGEKGHVIQYHGEAVVAIKKGFKAACARAGLTGVTPHILRHSAASWMAQAGVPLRQIAQMLGDEEKTVEKVYAKFSPDYLRDASSSLQLGL